MKTLLTSVFVLSIFIGFGQSKNDTINFNKVNYTLLNDLIFEKHNEERKKQGVQLRVKNDVCRLSSQYQADYMAHYSIACHDNQFNFRGVKLYEPKDRVNYFMESLKVTNKYEGEICYAYFCDTNFKITYEQLAQRTIDSFMKSLPHKIIMLGRNTFDSDQNGYFSVSTSLNNGLFNFYVTGLFTYVVK